MPWGSLTGIRPTKLVRELTQSLENEGVFNMLRNTFDVSEKKIDLAYQIVNTQLPVLNTIAQDDIDIYINIPFCVSRCNYCSFVTHDFNRANQFREVYLDALKSEILAFKEYFENKNIRSVYIGGGTPSALSEEELSKLMEICRGFKNAAEFTVEAGRPDTITDAKLQIMSDCGVTRISINPQTLNQNTLNEIGRKHTVEEFYKAFNSARKFNFKSINTDLILGLPGEEEEDMINSLNGIIELKPQNITIHTLALKRSAVLSTLSLNHFCKPEVIETVIENARNILADRGYYPYYLYRQKYMNGNLENTGFSEIGNICLYNIDNMEEAISILAFGAGSISKRLFNKEHRIERQANVKDVELYINNVDEMIRRKRQLFY